MFNKRIAAVLLAFAVSATALLAAGCTQPAPTPQPGPQPPPPPQRVSLDVRGSDTMVNLGAAWAEAYMGKYSNWSIAVQGGGSGTGIAQLIGKNCDIALSSRAIRGSELDSGKAAGIDIKEVIVAWDGVAMVVHPSNPVEELTLEQLGKIFRGEITNWKDVGGKDEAIVALSRDTASGTHVFIKEFVVQVKETLKGAEFGPQVQFLPSTSAIVTETAQNPRAIGYVGLGYLKPEVKAIKVKNDDASAAIPPSQETVQAGTYGVARPLFLYLPGEPKDSMKEYIDWILGSEGQQIVTKLGFVPAQ